MTRPTALVTCPDCLRMLSAEEMEIEDLQGPLQFFVEVSTYVNFGNAPPADSEIVYKKRRSDTIAGETCLSISRSCSHSLLMTTHYYFADITLPTIPVPYPLSTVDTSDMFITLLVWAFVFSFV